MRGHPPGESAVRATAQAPEFWGLVGRGDEPPQLFGETLELTGGLWESWFASEQCGERSALEAARLPETTGHTPQSSQQALQPHSMSQRSTGSGVATAWKIRPWHSEPRLISGSHCWHLPKPSLIVVASPPLTPQYMQEFSQARPAHSGAQQQGGGDGGQGQ